MCRRFYVVFLFFCSFSFVCAQNLTNPSPLPALSSSSIASTNEQHSYWIVSVICNFICLCVQAYLFSMYYKYDILHKIGVCAFILKSLADFIFAMTYFIHHLGNISTNGMFYQDNTLCNLTTAATSVSIFLDFYSDMTISYVAWLTVCAATTQRQVWITPIKLFIGGFIASLMGLMWFLMMYYDGSAGAYYGLYCFCNSWAHFSSGGILFLATATGITIMSINYFRLYLFVKDNTVRTENIDMSLRVAYRGIMLICVQMFTWFPLLISTIINIANVTPNIPFEMFAGWSVKINIFISSIITLTFIIQFANKLKDDSKSGSSYNNSHRTGNTLPPLTSIDKDSVREIRLSMAVGRQSTYSSESKQPGTPGPRGQASSVTTMIRV